MKVCHWSIQNGSGMHRVAESFAASEKLLGIDALFCDPTNSSTYEKSLDADVQVVHTHFPDELVPKVSKPLKRVWVAHGTPDHIFQGAIDSQKQGYGAGDGVMLLQHWLQNADARVTFWPRHAAIYQSLCDKGTSVDCIPLGVDKKFWKPVISRGKYSGSPSVYTSENPHFIKWPYDLFLAWPWAVPRIKGAPKLHAGYLVTDQHRFWFPLVNRNGCSYNSILSATVLGHEDLRNVLCSVDYYIGLVRYGDFNRMSHEANASGCKTISYCGNPYSDFWIHEGDQRTIADELVAILNGEVEPRAKETVPDISETSAAMIKIYERIL